MSIIYALSGHQSNNQYEIELIDPVSPRIHCGLSYKLTTTPPSTETSASLSDEKELQENAFFDCFVCMLYVPSYMIPRDILTYFGGSTRLMKCFQILQYAQSGTDRLPLTLEPTTVMTMYIKSNLSFTPALYPPTYTYVPTPFFLLLLCSP